MQHDQFQLHADIEQRHWWFIGRRKILCRLAVELLGDSPQATVIDVGCGTGANIAALADRYCGVGIDTSAEAIGLARQRFPNVRFLSGNAPKDLGETAAEAKLFLLTDVLEHVEDDFAMLSELLAAARPGSYFLLTVPADPSLWTGNDVAFGHYRRYEKERLEQVWAGLPVTTLLSSYFNTRLFPVIRAIRKWNQRRGRVSGQAGTDFWLPSAPVNKLLTAVFAGEAKRLIAALHRRQPAYASGASLVAVLRREPGEIAIRRKPKNLPADRR